MSPALNRSSALKHFERGNAIEIRNGIMFDIYPVLPYMSTNVVHFLLVTGAEQHCYLCVLPGKIEGGERGEGGAREGGEPLS